MFDEPGACLSERILQHIPKKLCMSRPVLKPVKGDSAITEHLKASPSCISDQLQQTGFTVLAQARSRAHLDVLEALFISRLAPPLCSQKDYVRTLALFQCTWFVKHLTLLRIVFQSVRCECSVNVQSSVSRVRRPVR